MPPSNIGAGPSAAAPRVPLTAELKQLSPQVRRRNRRWGLALLALTLACAVWTSWAARHGWIYPEETTFSFPHWIK